MPPAASTSDPESSPVTWSDSVDPSSKAATLCLSLYTSELGVYRHAHAGCPTSNFLASMYSVKGGVGLLSLWQFYHSKTEGVMEVGAQSMVKVILLQILPPLRETVWVCLAYYSDHLMYVKHLFFHHLVISLLDLIQGPDHGIVVPLVAKCSFHVHQQVPHRDVFAFIQHAGPFTRVPMKTGEDVGVHTGLIILLQKGIHIKMPECVRHLCPRIGRLEDQHIQSCWRQPFSFPAPPTAPAPMPVTHHLTHSGVSIGVWCSSVWG